MSDLVGNPEDRFSRVTALIKVKNRPYVSVLTSVYYVLVVFSLAILNGCSLGIVIFVRCLEAIKKIVLCVA